MATHSTGLINNLQIMTIMYILMSYHNLMCNPTRWLMKMRICLRWWWIIWQLGMIQK